MAGVEEEGEDGEDDYGEYANDDAIFQLISTILWRSEEPV